MIGVDSILPVQRVHLPMHRPVALAPDVPADPLVDPFARRIRYLRVSVTDRCNYRCSYCMPDDDVSFAPRAELLTFEEISRVVSVFARLGVRKVRLTGGEPTVRRDLPVLVGYIASVPNVEQVVMTTNGERLTDLADDLARAGLRAVNVSLDTLDPDRFRAVTGRGNVGRVVDGIDAARRAGLGVKINAVALRGVNDGEVAQLCEFAWSRDIVPRFIEHMPMSSGDLYDQRAELSAREIRDTVEAEFGALVPSENRVDGGPARYWRTPDGREVGIISAMTEHFCSDCNRLRLTATGDLHACLGHDDAISLRDVMREGRPDDDLVRAIAGAVSGKRAGHTFERDGTGGPAKDMIHIGG